MAGDVVAKIPRPPQMRNFLITSFKRTLVGATICAVAGTLAYKVFVADARKRKYAEFYRTYDKDKDFEIMREKGLFQSC